jgi:nicotinamide-nucleotide adenylyltransferase
VILQLSSVTENLLILPPSIHFPKMPSRIESLIYRVKQGFSTAELVHASHERWPLPRHASDVPRRLRISILDSSFNPPTLAHLALASIPASGRDSPMSTVSASQQPADFDARLLLLSVRNADKSLKNSDASYAQRLEMMILLAHDISEQANRAGRSSDPYSSDDLNIAVAIIDEPTFVGKSRVLHEYLATRLASFVTSSTPSTASDQPNLTIPSSIPKPELTFVVGIDTLERILALRYYSTEENMRRALREFLASDGDGSRLVCARRVTPGSLKTSDERERRVTATTDQYVEQGRVVMVNIDEKVESYSSSEVREKVARDDAAWMQMVTVKVAEYVTREGLYIPSQNNQS